MKTNEKIIENPYGFIYITTNMVNGRKYLGKKKFDDEDNWLTYLGSGTTLRRAIKKHGAESFSRNIVCFCNSLDELNKAEYDLSVYLNVVESDDWYNLQYGGAGGSDGRVVTESTRRKISESNTGKVHSEEFKEKMREKFKGENNPMYGRIRTAEYSELMRQRMSGENNPNYGRRRSEETKEKIRQSLKGKMVGEKNPNYGNHLSDEAKRKISMANKGRIPSEETRRKLSEAGTGRTHSQETIQKLSGENHYLYGKHLPDNVKEKISKSKKGKHMGIDNPNYGNGRSVVQLTLSGEFVAIYQTIREAERSTNINHAAILSCCVGRSKSSEGFIWMYSEVYDDTQTYIYTNNHVANVVQLDVNGVFISEYISMTDANRETGVSISAISSCCKDKRKTAGGFKWMYKEDYEKQLKNLNNND